MSLICSDAGVQQKFHDKETDYWYKEDCLGTEGLSEHITSFLLEHSNLEHVSYKACKFRQGKKKVIGCKSKNFLKENERLVSSYELFKSYRNIDIANELAGQPVEDKIKYFVENIIEITGIQDFGQYLTKMLQLDAITKNEDRHFRNICFIMNEQNKFRVAPVFDNGAAFLSDKYTFGENLSDEEIREQMKDVEAKPFSIHFDEQVDACEALYSGNISLGKIKELDKYQKDYLISMYSEQDINQALLIVREAERKYSYLFYDYEAERNKLDHMIKYISSHEHVVKQNYENHEWIIEIDKNIQFSYPDTKDGIKNVIQELEDFMNSEKEKQEYYKEYETKDIYDDNSTSQSNLDIKIEDTEEERV